MSKPNITNKTTTAQLFRRLSDLEDENAVLKTRLAREKEKLEAALTEVRESPDAPANLRLSEEELWDWCESYWHDSGGEDWVVDGLMLLLWNVTRQKCLIDSMDLVDRLIFKLYSLTADCSRNATDYLGTLPGKNYRPEEEQVEHAEQPAAPLAAVA